MDDADDDLGTAMRRMSEKKMTTIMLMMQQQDTTGEMMKKAMKMTTIQDDDNHNENFAVESYACSSLAVTGIFCAMIWLTYGTRSTGQSYTTRQSQRK
jgi:hypothetical protein